MGYLGPPVNAINDYSDEFNPYDQDVKVPDQWRTPVVRRRYRRLSGLGLEGIEGISDTVATVKQLVLDHFGLLLVAGVGLYWLWSKKEK